MKTNISLSIIMLLSLFSITYGMEQKSVFLHEVSGMHYTKNNFGDIFPQWHSVPADRLTDQLSTFVAMFKDEVKETPFLLEKQKM